jgi:glutaredoxin 3
VAKSYFVERGIEFADLDVSADRAALRDMLVTTGQHAVPVIMVGTRAMVGWDPARFEELLAT